jgi:hypothetical protein
LVVERWRLNVGGGALAAELSGGTLVAERASRNVGGGTRVAER